MTFTAADGFIAWFSRNKVQVISDLSALINVDTSGRRNVSWRPYIMERFTEIGFVSEVVKSPTDLADHPLYVAPSLFRTAAPTLPETVRFTNLPNPRDGLRSVLFNVHIDVVPAAQGASDTSFSAVSDGRTVRGRGSADTKNNLAMLLAALQFLVDEGVPLRRPVTVDVVENEEVGGSGTLASIVTGVRTDDVIVLEPTSLVPRLGHRGCISVEFEFLGRAVHMGSSSTGRSAIAGALELVRLLDGYESELLRVAREHEHFALLEKPCSINVGYINGGEWHGSVPERCVVAVNIGFTPPKTIAAVENELQMLIDRLPDPWDRENIRVNFNGLRNEACVLVRSSPLYTDLRNACVEAGMSLESPQAWEVSCDAHLYNQLTDSDTIIFGSGSLSAAHSSDEFVEIDSLATGGEVLVRYLTRD